MTTSAEQYRALVARLEAIEESPISAVADAAKSVANTVYSPDMAGSVLRALMTSGASVLAEIVMFLMKNKSQLSKPTQDVLQQFTDKNPGQYPKAGDNLPDTDSPNAKFPNAINPIDAPMRDPRQTKFPNVKGM